jgi:hypothetical protein
MLTLKANLGEEGPSGSVVTTVPTTIPSTITVVPVPTRRSVSRGVVAEFADKSARLTPELRLQVRTMLRRQVGGVHGVCKVWCHREYASDQTGKRPGSGGVCLREESASPY